ncbi:Diphthamide biosynthesis protein 2 [Zancudomyces culisetae]|uniref:Diphthamide biosynthesis protein 2 n=1 Tax=Zancudomyces culisetae TaxID=1213189 RepID=A0A1R1PBQ5_ZANCU|nr:Diphthamide biosynthesis protein 2 [Zancudomyces culisetae]|eukprot:OMH78398.1 Diphthamide biosynthesis protein 2 [Zancudomyces culisetae]
MDPRIKKYEIEEIKNLIKKYGYKRVGIQLPVEFIKDSVFISEQLKEVAEQVAIIMEEHETTTTYCCVDEITGQHYDCELIVQYGNKSCCSARKLQQPVSVFYVFPKIAVSEETKNQIMHKVKTVKEKEIVLMGDYGYEDLLQQLEEEFVDQKGAGGEFPDIVVEYKTLKDRYYIPKEMEEAIDSTSGPEKVKAIKECIVFIGTENSLALYNTMLKHCSSTIFLIDIGKSLSKNGGEIVLENIDTLKSKIIQKRYHKVQKIGKERRQQAMYSSSMINRIGILVTKFSERQNEMVKYLKRQIAIANKENCETNGQDDGYKIKEYVLFIGNPTVEKLGNFYSDIDAFVIVGCQYSFDIANNTKLFDKPILLPYEMLAAIRPEVFSPSEYIEDSELVLAKPYNEPSRVNGETEVDEQEFERQLTINGHKELIKTEYFVNRPSFRGLDVDAEASEPSVAEHGRFGVARGYDHEL